MQTLSRHMIEAVITRIQKSKADQQWTFGVSFIKKDGSDRTMSCRFHVKKHLKGGTRSWSRADHPNLMCVFDMNKKAYRTINLDTIYRVAVDGMVYEIVD